MRLVTGFDTENDLTNVNNLSDNEQKLAPMLLTIENKELNINQNRNMICSSLKSARVDKAISHLIKMVKLTIQLQKLKKDVNKIAATVKNLSTQLNIPENIRLIHIDKDNKVTINPKVKSIVSHWLKNSWNVKPDYLYNYNKETAPRFKIQKDGYNELLVLRDYVPARRRSPRPVAES